MSCKPAFAASTALALLFAAPAFAEDRPAALIISQSGLGDQSYNDLAYAGFERALASTGIEGRTVESKEVVAQADEILRRASDAGFGLILDLEFAHGEPIAAVAKDDAARAGILDASIADNLIASHQHKPGFAAQGFLKPRAIADFAAERVAAFENKCASPRQPVRALSGGNQQKITMARELYDNLRVPLAFRDGGGAVLLISEDLDELVQLSDRIVTIYCGRITGEFPRGDAGDGADWPHPPHRRIAFGGNAPDLHRPRRRRRLPRWCLHRGRGGVASRRRADGGLAWH